MDEYILLGELKKLVGWLNSQAMYGYTDWEICITSSSVDFAANNRTYKTPFQDLLDTLKATSKQEDQ